MSEGGITRLIFENAHSNDADQTQFTPSNLFSGNASTNSSNVYHDSLEIEKKRAFEQSYQEAATQAKIEWDAKFNLINNIADALNQPLNDIDKIIQEKSVEIAISIAKQIVRRELSLDSGQIVSTVKQAIELIPTDGEQINIHINPSDEDNVKDLFSSNEKLSKYNIIYDPTISVGGCKASTDYS